MARCKSDKIVSSSFNSHPTNGKVKILDTGKLLNQSCESDGTAMTAENSGALLQGQSNNNLDSPQSGPAAN